MQSSSAFSVTSISGYLKFKIPSDVCFEYVICQNFFAEHFGYTILFLYKYKLYHHSLRNVLLWSWKTKLKENPFSSIWTGPIPWTNTWRWWSTAMGWWQHQQHRRCSATPAGSTWRNMVRTSHVWETGAASKGLKSDDYILHWVQDFSLSHTHLTFQAQNPNTLPKLPGKTTSIPPTTRKT